MEWGSNIFSSGSWSAGLKMRELLLRQGPCLLPVLFIAPSHWNTRALIGVPHPRVHGWPRPAVGLPWCSQAPSPVAEFQCPSSLQLFYPSVFSLWFEAVDSWLLQVRMLCVPSLLCECVLNNRTRDHCHRLKGTTDRGLSVYEDPDKVIFIYPGTRVCWTPIVSVHLIPCTRPGM